MKSKSHSNKKKRQPVRKDTAKKAPVLPAQQTKDVQKMEAEVLAKKKLIRQALRRKATAVPIRSIRPIGMLYWWLFGVIFLFYHEIGIESGTFPLREVIYDSFFENDEMLFELDRKDFFFDDIYQDFTNNVSTKKFSSLKVESVLGKSVNLPCDINPAEVGDAVFMVLWFREGNGEPIYIYDARKNKGVQKGRYWSSPQNFGPRAYFNADSKTAYLKLDKVTKDDQGNYRCRVDFRNSPTRNIQLNLSVIEPPETPMIYEPTAVDKMNGVGTFNEGADMILICETSGGNPLPSLTWYLDDKVLDDQYEHRGDKTFNTLLLQNISRKLVHKRLTCAASNTNLTAPVTRAVYMELNLLPTAVNIGPKPRYFSAGKLYELSCESTGSKPAAQVSWWKNGKQMKKVAKIFKEDSLDSLSILSFTPDKHDDGVDLICRAENSQIKGSFIEESFRVAVHYKPEAHLSLGRTLNADDIKEGDDVYFECVVLSNPKPHKTVWFHQGKEIVHNISRGIILSDSSLVLQRIARNSTGEYTCSAYNSEGKGSSNVVSLRVRYVPICAKPGNDPEFITLQHHETFELRCEVYASPSPKTFHWSFNKSSSHTHVAGHIVTAETSVSCFNYTLLSEEDYGTVTCYAENKVGRQESPCVFQIVAAGRPQTVKKCSIAGQSSSSVSIECSGLFETQIPHRYNLELMDMTNFRLVRNVTIDSKPVYFDLMYLDPDATYQALIYSINAHGKSEPFVMDPISFKSFASLTKPSDDLTFLAAPYMTYLGIFCFVLFLLSCVVFTFVMKKLYDRRRSMPKPEAGASDNDSIEDGFRVDENNAPVSQRLLQPATTPLNDGDNQPGNVIIVSAINEGGSHRSTLQSQSRLSPQAVDESIDIDETDPDVIPNQFERRPAKQLQGHVYRSPSARLMQHEYFPMDTGSNLSFGSPAMLGFGHTSSYSSDIGTGFNSMISNLNMPSIHGRNDPVQYAYRPAKQVTYATLNKNGITTSAGYESSFNNPSSSSSGFSSYSQAPPHQTPHSANIQPNPQAMEVTSLNPNHQSVTSTVSEYRYRPEIVTTSNRIQESCI